MGFGLVTEETLRYLEILATPIETLPIRYLGLPLIDRRLRIQDWQLVVEKVETPGGMARKTVVSRGPPSLGKGSLVRHSNVLHVGLLDASRGATAPRRCHEEFFLARGRPCQGVPLLPGARYADLLLLVDLAFTTFSMQTLPN